MGRRSGGRIGHCGESVGCENHPAVAAAAAINGDEGRGEGTAWMCPSISGNKTIRNYLLEIIQRRKRLSPPYYEYSTLYWQLPLKSSPNHDHCTAAISCDLDGKFLFQPAVLLSLLEFPVSSSEFFLTRFCNGNAAIRAAAAAAAAVAIFAPKLKGLTTTMSKYFKGVNKHHHQVAAVGGSSGKKDKGIIWVWECKKAAAAAAVNNAHAHWKFE